MKKKISVVLTSFNGENFLNEQINSILKQLGSDDELIISDDGSKDNTLKILENLAENDSRVKFYKNSKLGANNNFEFCLTKVTGDIIYFSDQDDIWTKNKIKKTMEIMEDDNIMLLEHNGINFKKNSKNIIGKLIPVMKHGRYRNILLSSYWGCCICFKKELLSIALPFPRHLPAYDQWFGLIGECLNSSVFIKDELIYHRIHSANVTRKRKLVKSTILCKSSTSSKAQCFAL